MFNFQLGDVRYTELTLSTFKCQEKFAVPCVRTEF